MKKFILMFSALVFCIGAVFGQGKTISGQVVDDANNEPIIGATIQVKGAESTGTITDFDGNFTITMPDGKSVLIIAYMGYDTKEVTARNGMVVRLASGAEALDEVMVVAYGTSTKKSFAGSATVVKGETLEKKNPSEVSKALAGEIAGVQVVSSSGQPGSSASIRIRGIGSVNSSTSPLYVVDGVPYDGDISGIDPSDIASTTVLKDATATALYGSRGSNGVIILTTKKGTSGETGKIDVDIKYGGNMRLIPLYETIKDPKEYVQYTWEGIYNSTGRADLAAKYLFDSANSGLPSYYNRWDVDGEYLIDYENYPGANNQRGLVPFSNIAELKPGYQKHPDESWQKSIFRTGQKLDATLKIHGGSEKTTYFTSFGYLMDEGYYIGSDYSRLSARVNVDHQAKKWLRGNVNMAYSYSTINNPGQSSNMNNGFAYVNEIPPIYGVFQRDADGYYVDDPKHPGQRAYDYGDMDVNGNTIGRLYGQGINPAGALLYDKQKTLQHQFVGNAMLEITFFKGFKFLTNFGAQYVGSVGSELTNPFYGDAANVGRIYKLTNDYLHFTFNQQLIYNSDFGGDHNFEALLAHETDYTRQTQVAAGKNYLARPEGLELGNAIEMSYVTSDVGKVTLESYLGQVRYNYKEKYFIHGSLRGDGSSRFARGHRWGLFGAIGAAWLISNEDFMQDVNLLRDLKLKASWGVLGNQNISTFMYTNWYSVENVDGNIGYTLNYIGNRDISWERSNQVNVGLEFRLGNYFDADINYYYKLVTDMLFPRYVAPSLGYSSYYVNDASMSNQGIEFQFNVHAVNTNAVKLDIRLNGGHYSNRIVAMPVDNSGKPMEMNGSWSLGRSVNEYYLPEYVGVNPSNGKAQYKAFYDPNNIKNALQEKIDPSTVDDKNIADYLPYSSILSVYQYVIDNYNPNAPIKEGEKGNIGQQNGISEATYQDMLKHPEKYFRSTSTDNYTLASNYYIGKRADPILEGGFGLDLTLYGVDISATFQYSLGGWGMDYSYQTLMHSGRGGSNNWHVDIADRWQYEGQVTDVPRLSNGQDIYANASSTRFLISSSYLTLSNVRVGYSLPKKWIEKIKLTNLNLWVAADNLFCLSARKGYIPMSSFTGSSNNYQYTPLSTIMGGIKFSF